ncbi:hypothetical protein TNIN_272561 [Trichonephila inaurata madagascariensis]|uniref:Uncharacterized protein n=1 Tax=Trichonephila inaurata madagascariensis TaxID=2747483 RepID=A0A8X7BZW1_9ARAC|nr:hypothetical protein TNIN_272561 [Trichonephila inaurata madagascariensis]
MKTFVNTAFPSGKKFVLVNHEAFGLPKNAIPKIQLITIGLTAGVQLRKLLPILLHSYPASLQSLERPDGTILQCVACCHFHIGFIDIYCHTSSKLLQRQNEEDELYSCSFD